MDITLGDRAVIITGAGSGLGRSHALHMAKLGALVAVNDLKLTDAEAVVAEIEAAGGHAFAFAGSVTDAGLMADMVTATMDAFGRLDIVVNNAGITLDGAFHNMPYTDIERVIQIHLLGTEFVTRAAWPILRKQPGSRVINTASDSGLYGNFGQANYGGAKMGVVGFTRALADEGRKAGVGVNAIVPVAYTPMTEELFAPFGITADQLGPQWVSPLVAYLATEACTETGMIWNCAGGNIGVTRIVENLGKRFASVEEMSLDAIAAAIPEITATDGEWDPQSMNDKLMGQITGDDAPHLFGRLG